LLGFGVIWVALAAVLVLVVTRVGGARRVGKVIGLMLLALVALRVLITGGVFTAVALSGVPMHRGVGDLDWSPTVASQVQRDYRLAIGNMTVDLRNVRFPAGSTSVTASVGVGHMLVEVPPGVDVGVNAHSGIGAVVYGDGQGDADVGSLGTGSPGNSGSASGPHLNLTATAGVGVVQLARGQGGTLWPTQRARVSKNSMCSATMRLVEK
jgi:predicted membrane protein